MLSMMDSPTNTPYVSHPSPAPALQSSFSDTVLYSGLESSPFPESQRTLPIDPFSNAPLPPSSADRDSNPTHDFDLDIISNRHGTNKCAIYPERKTFIDHPGRGNGTKTMIRHPNTRQCTYQDPQKCHASIKDFLGKGSVSVESTPIRCYANNCTNSGIFEFPR